MNHQEAGGPRAAGGLVSSTATYRGTISSQRLSGDAHLVIEERGLLAETAYDSAFMDYESIRSIAYQDYAVVIRSREGEAVIRRLGNAGDWFFKELCESFNQLVQTALQAAGPMQFEARGPRYRYEDREGNACFRVFRDEIMLLPPNLDARRLPFLFLSRMESKDFAITLTLTTGEVYQFSKFGENQAPFERIVNESCRQMRSRHAELVALLDRSLGRGRAIEAAKVLPEGVAVLLTDVKSSFPSLASILDQFLLDGRIGPYYAALKKVGDETKLAIGFKEFKGTPGEKPEGEEKDEEEERPQEESLEEASSGEDTGEAQPPAWAFWAIIPSHDGRKAMVEFAFPNEKAATYLFNIEGSYERFLVTLNRAFEASGFQREMLFLTDEQLEHPDRELDRILMERTPSLQILRKQFAGRVIHRSVESWKRSLQKQLG
ncbi:MAG TPA: hypothetical protein PK646_03615 [Bacillota bacterium]|jgi:hypothetical protein|nr:hypothetical protein [Fastidiosipila sp.]HPX92571.1 hypothetical protein [Bacillota bacterium]HQB81161.1 hypothetical protein [Bacillota bacterium]